MFVTDELNPSIVFDMARINPVTGFVTRPVKPKIVPFRIPTPPSSWKPIVGCSTIPVMPLPKLYPNSINPILSPVAKLSAFCFLSLYLLLMNYLSKVSSLKPLPIVPIILLILLLIPATIALQKGKTPPLFLAASNSLLNWAGFPRMLSPEAMPTKASMAYIWLMLLICLVFKGTLMSI